MDFLTSRLPAELVDSIIENLCHYCEKDAQAAWYELFIKGPGPGKTPIHIQPKIRAKRRDLYSLCLTSRALNRMATRHLYESVSTHYLTSWWLLARTLIENPQLAKYVKRLVGDSNVIRGQDISSLRREYYHFGPGDNIGYYEWYLRRKEDRTIGPAPPNARSDAARAEGNHVLPRLFICYPPSVISYYQSEVSRWSAEHLHDAPEGSNSSIAALSFPNISLGDMHQACPNLGFSILVTLCPNLEQLSLARLSETNPHDRFELAQGRSLNKLKMLVLHDRNSQNVWRPHMGRYRLELEGLMPFFSTMPNLEVASLQGLAGCEFLSKDSGQAWFQNLKVLYLTQPRLGPVCIRTVLRGCPGLKAMVLIQCVNEDKFESEIALTTWAKLDALRTGIKNRSTPLELLSFWFPVDDCWSLPHGANGEGLVTRGVLEEAIKQRGGTFVSMDTNRHKKVNSRILAESGPREFSKLLRSFTSIRLI